MLQITNSTNFLILSETLKRIGNLCYKPEGMSKSLIRLESGVILIMTNCRMDVVTEKSFEEPRKYCYCISKQQFFRKF